MLLDLVTCKQLLNVLAGDTSQDAWLTALIPTADGLIKRYCKQALESQAQVEYRDGAGTQDLALYQRPIKPLTLTGTLAAGLPTVTGLASTSNLLVGMPAVALQAGAQGTPGGFAKALPAGATIASVDSGSQVTLTWPAGFTANAQASGSYSIFFGLDVYLDNSGLYGDGPGGFAQITQQVLGADYLLKRDQPDGSSKCAIIKRLGAGITGGVLQGAWPQELRRGTLTARLPPVWPLSIGNIKVIYVSGYGLGPNAVTGATAGGVANIPQDLQLACATQVAWLKRTLPLGGSLQSETLGRYSYQLHFPTPGEPPEVGSIRQLLSRYRDVSA